MFRHSHLLIVSPLVVCAALTLSGCGNNTVQTEPTTTAPTAGEQDHKHGHAHPSEGPHHGDLVELGSEEYHAEVVRGEGDAVTIYILDATAKNAVPIEATEVTLNLTHDGKPEQVQLPATPEASDGQGKSSKFSVVNAELASHLDDEKSSARLVVTVAGKQYTGKVEHHRDHAHGHEHK
jgi:hypothetical protein